MAKLAESVVDIGVEFDLLARRQRAVLNISAEQQAPLIAQAVAIGATTPFKQPEVTAAQTAIAEQGIRDPTTIKAITSAAANYAQAQGIGLPEASKQLGQELFASGKMGAGAEAVTKELEHTADMLAKASQVSGITASGMEEVLKGHIAEAAGISLPFVLSQAAVLRKANVPEPGMAVNRFATMLSKPTPDALAAMGALGIRFGDYAKSGPMRAADLSAEFAPALGRHLSASGLKNVQAVLDNKAIAGDEQKLTAALTKILQEAPKKAGGKSPDAAAIGK